jgi:ribosome maturation factor RimP
MRYAAKEAETDEKAALRRQFEAVLEGMEMRLIELAVFQHRGSVQAKAVIDAAGKTGAQSLGVNECAKAHRALAPRLDLAFPQKDISLEVSSPGIQRLIKNGAEFAHFTGRGVRCFRTDISDWTEGILEASDEKGIMLKTREGAVRLDYEIIAKAKLEPRMRDARGEVSIGN